METVRSFMWPEGNKVYWTKRICSNGEWRTDFNVALDARNVTSQTRLFYIHSSHYT